MHTYYSFFIYLHIITLIYIEGLTIDIILNLLLKNQEKCINSPSTNNSSKYSDLNKPHHGQLTNNQVAINCACNV